MNNNIIRYLRAFIIGSSFLVVLPFISKVASLDESDMNYTYKTYSFIAPLYLGVMNMVSLYLADQFDLSLRERFLLIGTISPLIVASFAYLTDKYNFTQPEWIGYAVRLWFKHFLTFNVAIFLIEKYIMI